MKHIIPAIAVAAVLTLGSWAPLSAEEEKEESISTSDVPAAAQKAVEAEAKGGTIVRWEKEGSNYEAGIEKNGKQKGVEVSPDAKTVCKNNHRKRTHEKG